MEFIDWAVRTATKHPQLRDAVVTSDGDWLDVLLADGGSFRFRPAALIRPSADETTRTELLFRLLTIAIEQERQDAQREKEESEKEARRESSDGCHSPSGEHSTNPLSDNRSSASMRENHQRLPDSLNIRFERDADDEYFDDPFDSHEDYMADAPMLPIVRNAAYFLRSHTEEGPLAYIPLTEFIGVGLAYDSPRSIRPVRHAEIIHNGDVLGDALAHSVFNLRQLTYIQHRGIEIRHYEIAGAEVLVCMHPSNYESSWLADVEIMNDVAQRLVSHHPDAIALFIPAAPTKLYIVYSDDPHLADFFKLLLAQRDFTHAIYPLPHTVAADGWREWIPLPDSELSEVLGALRNVFREHIYKVQSDLLYSWSDEGVVKDFHSRRLASGERVSLARWNALDRYGSIPDTDFISFVRDPSPHPWDPDISVNVTVRSVIARDLWPQGIHRLEHVWPPRWEMRGFPDDATLRKLQNSAGLDF